MSEESNIGINGTVNNNEMEETKMTTQNNVTINGINMTDLVKQAAVEAKYSGLKSFFETDEGDTKEYIKVGEYFADNTSHRIVDAAYITPKDVTKDEFAVVTSEKRPWAFTYFNRTGKEFIRRLRDIAKSQRVSMANILKEVNVQVQVKKTLRKGHEGEQFGVLEDGSFNWFYDYVITVVE